MITINLTLERRHLIALVGLAMAVILLIPGASWASNQFTDVPNTNVFHEDIAWLADAGVTKGCNPPANDEFCPSNNVTREQMAAFMHRLYNEKIAPLEADNTALKALLAGVTRNGDTLLFTGMNVQVVNGAGITNTTNSLGNLIVGYNANNSHTRTGSHMLVVGDQNSYTSYGGIVAGLNNTTSGAWSSVTGGSTNTASAPFASVSGGWDNTASGIVSLVSGGRDNTASSTYSSVSGGRDNTASGIYSSVSGGQDNTANGNWSSVTGGRSNLANRDYSMIAGGFSGGVTGGTYGAILGGRSNSVGSDYATISGGRANITSGTYASIGGGDSMLCSSNSAVFCGEGTLNPAD